ncbi:MAG: YceI family protein [Bacteroidia bacterium]
MKIKLLLIAIFTVAMLTNAFAQKYITKTGKIDIFSETPAFTIEAENRTCASILNTETGDVVVSLLVRSFDFEEALVEEHFNENYIESHKFPKSTFKGKITNNDDIAYDKNGEYKFDITGDLNIHGVTKAVTQQGVITVNDGVITANIEFIVSLKAYEVKIEKAYTHAIKDEIALTCEFSFETKK